MCKINTCDNDLMPKTGHFYLATGVGHKPWTQTHLRHILFTALFQPFLARIKHFHRPFPLNTFCHELFEHFDDNSPFVFFAILKLKYKVLNLARRFFVFVFQFFMWNKQKFITLVKSGD